MRNVYIALIILLFPLFATAHSLEGHFSAASTAVPGEAKYCAERIGEWFAVNIFTVSTRAKQQTKAALADERLAELIQLLATNSDEKQIRKALANYIADIAEVRDMAQKIIILDGAEIALASDFERQTRLQEEALVEILEIFSGASRSAVMQALSEARSENRDMFRFMALHYQATDQDVRRHQNILEKHLQFVMAAATGFDAATRKELDPIIAEARKFQKAGLNVQAYGFIDRAKNKLYGKQITNDK